MTRRTVWWMSHEMSEAQGALTGRPARKPHLSELDRLRIITALSVVAVHTLGNSTFLDPTLGALTAQNAAVTALHFTREVFMFVTALALVYVYYGKPFDTRRFWWKRAVGVLLPYSLWTLLYVVINTRPTSAGGFIRTSLIDLVTGNASYQLYYILLTLEFYILFPWFLRLLPRLARHMWVTLGVSFAIEVAILVFDHQILPSLPLSSGARAFVYPFLDRFVLVYQFYFVLGAFAALHLPTIKAFLMRHGGWMIAAGALALLALEGNFLVQVLALRIPMSDAVAVLQPMMAPYSLGAIAFMYWLSLTIAQSDARRGARRAGRVWHELSDAAFGVYLVHPIILGATMAVVTPRIRTMLPVGVTVAIAWTITAAGSVLVTIALLKLPVLSRLVGRAGPTLALPGWATRQGWRSRRAASRSAAEGDGLRGAGMSDASDVVGAGLRE